MGTFGRAVFFGICRAHARQRPLRILCRRVVLPRLQSSFGLGICGPAAVDRRNHLAGARDAGRFTLRSAFFARGRSRLARLADRLDRARTRRAAVWHRAGLRLRGRCAYLPGTRFDPDDERLRVAVLDERGSGRPGNLQWCKPKALAIVRRDLRRWIAQQALHVDLWVWSFRRLAAHFAKKAVRQTVDLARADSSRC